MRGVLPSTPPPRVGARHLCAVTSNPEPSGGHEGDAASQPMRGGGPLLVGVCPWGRGRVVRPDRQGAPPPPQAQSVIRGLRDSHTRSSIQGTLIAFVSPGLDELHMGGHIHSETALSARSTVPMA